MNNEVQNNLYKACKNFYYEDLYEILDAKALPDIQ